LKPHIRKKILEAPDLPGIYIFKDHENRVLYVGKARSLKNRLRSYLSQDVPIKTRTILRKADSLDYVITKSEVEALVLEANFIKVHKPKYNIRLKDDKKYPYIKITIKEDYPAVYPTRNLSDQDALYFGPYTNVKSLKKALRAAREVFPVRLCRKMPKKVCLAYHIGICPGVCEAKVSKEEYRKNLKKFIELLTGKSQEVEKFLEQKMQEAAEKLEYERAATLRDKLFSVREIIKKQHVVFDEPLNIDIIGIARGGKLACTEVLHIREGRMMSAEHYILQVNTSDEDKEILEAFLVQYYRGVYYVPDEIILPYIKDEQLIKDWLRKKITIPKSGKKKELLTMAMRNAELHLVEEYPTKPPKSILELQKWLKLEKLPTKIEAFDVSHFGGKQLVGSCVVFVDGKPYKAGYRRFKIKTVTGIDDYKAMEEIVRRRYDEKENLPDLILIDGGLGQLNSAIKVLKDFGLNIPALGLAKRFEQLYLPDGRIVSLPKDSLALRLLQRIRDEAHRFAISYQRKLRKESLRSILDEIKGVGERRKQMLIRYFYTLDRIKKASIDEIARVPGIGHKLAEIIYNALHEG